jgi:integrase
MSKFADLKQPEQIKAYIANKQCSTAYKHLICTYYDMYCRYYKIEWKKPRYQQENRAIQVPKTEKIEILINSAKSPLCIKLGISAKTGLRPIELYTLQVKHVDLEKKQIYPATAKGGSERILNIDNVLRDQIAAYIEEHHLQPNDQLFKGNPENYSKVFRAYRNRLSQKLHDPSLRQIRLYDLRHYFGSMLYAKTGVIVYVSRQMGHKHIDTTMRYMHLVPISEDYTAEIAANAQEAKKLVENGYEYVQTLNPNEHLYRKRKILF